MLLKDGGAQQAAVKAPAILYVTQLDPSIKGDDLSKHFREQPGFETAFVMNVDDEGGQQQYMGYVQFDSGEAAAAAQKVLDGSQLQQQRIKVRTKRTSSPEPAGESGADGPSTPQQASQHATTTDAASAAAETAASAGAASSSSSSSSRGGADAAAPQEDTAGAEGSQQGLSRSDKYQQRQARRRQPVPPANPCMLFVPYLRGDTTEQQLADHFREQPGYEGVSQRLVSGRRNDGYVTFNTPEAAAAAKEALADSRLNGKCLVLYIHELFDKERAQRLSAANAAKSQQKQQQQRAKQEAADAPAAAAAAGAEDAAQSPDSDQKQRKHKAKQPRQQRQRKGEEPGAAAAAAADSSSPDGSTTPTPSSAATSSSSGSEGGKQEQQRGKQQGKRVLTYDLKVANLAWSTTDEGLTQHFSDCKGFVSATTIFNRELRPSGIGYVKFSSAAAAQEALQTKHETELDGRPLNITITQKEQAKIAAAAAGQPRPALPGKGAWALQVFNLAWGVTDQELVDHFSACPGFTGAFLVAGPDSRPSGQGYVTFDSAAAQLEALKTKQNSELLGRSVYLRSTAPGRVEDRRAAAAAAAGGGGGEADGSGTEASTGLVLMGLPPSFTYREVLGLCSYFGEVTAVVRMRKDMLPPTDSSSSSGGGGSDAAGVDPAAAAGDARSGQPCFVTMASAKAAAAAVKGLNGRFIQRTQVSAAFATPRKRVRARLQPKTEAGAQGDAEAAAAAVGSAVGDSN